MRQAAPPGMKVNVVNIEKAVRCITTRNIRTKPFFIFSLAQGCLSNGSPGGKNRYPEYWRLAWRPGKKQLTKAVSLDDDDLTHFMS